jgi:hypothetical protein
MFSGKFVILFILNTFVSITVFPQVKILSENTKIKPEKVVKIRTTVTPRKSNVVFVGKAMEVTISPLDEFGNEIKEIPSGLNVNLSISDAVAEHDQVGRKIIYGKTYLYLTPLKPHNIPNVDVLKVGAFLPDSITGLPNLSTGEFANVLVVDHMPVPPGISTFKIKNETKNKDILNNQLEMYEYTKNEFYLFSWEKAEDSNDLPLKKYFAEDKNDRQFWIQDQCQVKYRFIIKEYPNYMYKNIMDTNNSFKVSSFEFIDIFKFLKVGAARSVFVNYAVICEDDIYIYTNPEYSDKLITAYKKIEIIVNIPDEIEKIKDVPVTYSLFQNYPNPFNPNTTIKIGLPKESNINVSIYNIFGQNIKTLINKKESPGFKALTWDGKNDKGIPVSSGTYIYTITTGDFVQVKRMHLIK